METGRQASVRKFKVKQVQSGNLEMTAYEKTVADIAARIYVSDVEIRFRANPDDSVPVQEAISEAITDAFLIIDGVLECTR